MVNWQTRRLEQGVLGHSAINRGKSDPGPLFDWDRLLDGLTS